MRWLCEALGVSRSGFHAWLAGPPSARSRSAEILLAQIKSSFVGSDRTYGARRVWHDVLAEGAACGLHRVERLMHEQALRAQPRRGGLPLKRGGGQRTDSAIEGHGAEPEVGRRLHLHLDGRRLALRGCRHRPVLALRS